MFVSIAAPESRSLIYLFILWYDNLSWLSFILMKFLHKFYASGGGFYIFDVCIYCYFRVIILDILLYILV